MSGWVEDEGRWMDGQMFKYKYGQMDRLMNRWMDDWLDVPTIADCTMYFYDNLLNIHTYI